MHWPLSACRGSRAPHCCSPWLHRGCLMHLLLPMGRRESGRNWKTQSQDVNRSTRSAIWQALPPQDPLLWWCFSEALLPPGKLWKSDILLCFRDSDGEHAMTAKLKTESLTCFHTLPWFNFLTVTLPSCHLTRGFCWPCSHRIPCGLAEVPWCSCGRGESAQSACSCPSSSV